MGWDSPKISPNVLTVNGTAIYSGYGTGNICKMPFKIRQQSTLIPTLVNTNFNQLFHQNLCWILVKKFTKPRLRREYATRSKQFSPLRSIGRSAKKPVSCWAVNVTNIIQITSVWVVYVDTQTLSCLTNIVCHLTSVRSSPYVQTAAAEEAGRRMRDGILAGSDKQYWSDKLMTVY